ncbi:ATP-binding protein [Shouchella hunanensis]|uniref:histidine kinase n=1 Tax=Shouchella hunanensis TaxID=766894 RepID=A0ABY7W7W8_9BACI|nr:sensor histidine kinase [Shouchella hunanensis]WDF04969.1 sensor histidine kinase [Shouchella hunanensis]
MTTTKRTLEKKFRRYVTALIALIMLLITFVYIYLEREQARNLIGEQALTTALTVAEIPEVKQALIGTGDVDKVREMIDQIQRNAGAEYIVIGDGDGVRLTHPNREQIGQEMVGGDNDDALLYGRSYTSLAQGSLGEAVRGKTPIRAEDGSIIGVVSVGYMIEYINATFLKGFTVFASAILVIFLIGMVGSNALARSIRRDTFGLEPYQIARLYKERHAVIEAVSEGLLATDQDGRVTLLNALAKEVLQIDEQAIGQKIDQVLPDSEIAAVLQTEEATGQNEVIVNEDRLIIYYQIISEDGHYAGKVARFQNRTELQELVNALSEIQQYSKDLRAQTHEYTNKLYAISGYLQLGYYDEAIDFIEEETGTQSRDDRIVFEQIQDPTIQAILIGKRSKASEKKISFTLDPASTVEWQWPAEAAAPLVTIIGNVVDNAFDAVIGRDKPTVEVFLTDLGKELIVEVADNGSGIAESIQAQLFEQGTTTKSGQRGYGLALVKAALKELNGTLEIEHNQPSGTIMSLYIPKEQVGERSERNDSRR